MLLKTSEARDWIESKYGVTVTTQTVTKWVREGKVAGKKVGGRYYVDWDSLVHRLIHDPEDSSS